MKNVATIAVTAGVVLLAVASQVPAHAGDLDATASSQATAGKSATVDRQDSYDLGANLLVSAGGSSATAVINPRVPSVAVSGVSPVQADIYESATGAYSYLYWYYAVPGATEAVPVDVSYDLTASSTTTLYNTTFDEGADGVYAAAGINVVQPLYDNDPYYNTSYQNNAVSGQTAPGITGQTAQGIFKTMVNPGLADEVELSVVEYTYADMNLSSSADAYADPTVYIDPTYLAAHPGLTLEISPGVGNLGPSGSPVPEPSAWALMLAGVGVLGGKLRAGRGRRRRLEGHTPSRAGDNVPYQVATSEATSQS